MAWSRSTGYRPGVEGSADQRKSGKGVSKLATDAKASDAAASPEGGSPAYGEGESTAGNSSPDQRAIDQERVTQLVASSQDLVQAAVARLNAEGVMAEREDLVAFGQQGLVEAAGRYEPSQGPFRRFAYYRVRGAMIDGVRKMGPWTRRGYERVSMLRALDATSESLEDSMPQQQSGNSAQLSATEAAERLRQHMASMVTAVTVGVFAEQAREGEEMISRDDSAPADELLAERELRNAVREALDELTEPDGSVMRRHYLGGERLDRIAAELGFSKSWASRIHARALKKLGARLRYHCR